MTRDKKKGQWETLDKRQQTKKKTTLQRDKRQKYKEKEYKKIQYKKQREDNIRLKRDMRQRKVGIKTDKNKTKDNKPETKRQKDEVMYKNARDKGQRILNDKPKYK